MSFNREIPAVIVAITANAPFVIALSIVGVPVAIEVKVLCLSFNLEMRGVPVDVAAYVL
jgi:hypothetical protein